MDDANKKLDDMVKAYRTIIRSLGEDPDSEGLQDTPKRAAVAMDFINRGYAICVYTVFFCGSDIY